jgi:hypothetical protein
MGKGERREIIHFANARAQIPSRESDHAVSLLERGTFKGKLSVPVSLRRSRSFASNPPGSGRCSRQASLAWKVTTSSPFRIFKVDAACVRDMDALSYPNLPAAKLLARSLEIRATPA